MDLTEQVGGIVSSVVILRMPCPTTLCSIAVSAHTSSGGGSGHLLDIHIYNAAIPGLAEAHIPAAGGYPHVQQAWVMLALWYLGMLASIPEMEGEREAGAWGRLSGPPNLKGGRTQSRREPKKEGGGVSNQLASLGATAHPPPQQPLSSPGMPLHTFPTASRETRIHLSP